MLSAKKGTTYRHDIGVHPVLRGGRDSSARLSLSPEAYDTISLNRRTGGVPEPGPISSVTTGTVSESALYEVWCGTGESVVVE